MDRAEAIKVLTLERCSHRAGGLVERAIDVAIAVLREQERNEQDCAKDAHYNEWISVEEWLPENLVDVLLRHADGTIDIGCRFQCLGGFLMEREWGRVTHWMPLPEPPEGGTEE